MTKSFRKNNEELEIVTTFEKVIRYNREELEEMQRVAQEGLDEVNALLAEADKLKI